uniref:ETS homologous factor n=1 Tax=Hucho hucho TaxID=62062 RepID=A0A4W5JVY7_9TELE
GTCLSPPALDHVSTVMPGYTSRMWSQDYKPQYWSKYLVWQWLKQMVDMYQIDAASIPFQNFDVDGRQLCSMTCQDFTRAAGTVGPILYHSLNELKWSGGNKHLSGNEKGGGVCLMINETWCDDNNIQELKSFCSPDIEFLTIKCRPRWFYCPPPMCFSSDTRGTHLWEFIRDILLNPERNSGLLKWEDRTDGVFRFLKSETVAQLWGKKKNNSSMTYEKLSRAMRYYYKREILEHVDGRRLVYKFGKNAQGWRESEK